MRLLTAARTGLLVGFAILMSLAVWLGPQLLGRSAGRADVSDTMGGALRALWIAQGVAIVLAAPRGLGSSTAARTLGLGALIAVAFPLLAAAWLAHAATGRALARGVALSVAWGAVAVALAGAAERLDPEPRRVALAAVEVGLAAVLWGLRESWLGWIRT